MRKLLFFCLIIAFASNGYAQNIHIGVIHTLHSNMESNLFHIYLEDKPVFDTGDCSSYWTGNSMDNEKFRQYILPLLLTAYAREESIRVRVIGCNQGYPAINDVDLAPR